jgi:hypothetical protein
MIHDFWINQLKKVGRPSASLLTQKLVHSNPLGFVGAKHESVSSSRTKDLSKLRVVDLASGWKRVHYDKVLLVRMGDFYEAWGVDAIMLVEYAGLNPMGDSCRAGCPKGNIQQTLNSLTDAGLSVAVYEEVNVVGSRSSKVRKERYLSQVVTPGRPMYLHDTCLREGEIPFRPARPYAAIRCTKDGCSIAFMWVDSREIRVSERVTEDAVGSLIESVGGISEPVWISLGGVTGSKFKSFLPCRVNRLPTNLSFDAFITAVTGDLSRMLSISDTFNRIQSMPYNDSDRLRPLHASTAQFLGLSSTPGSADLVKHLLPDSAPFYCSYFLRQWLLSPPPRLVADSMRSFVWTAAHLSEPVPKYTVVPVDKLIRLIESGNGNFHFFSDLYASCEAFGMSPNSILNSSELLSIVSHCSGIALAPASSFQSRADSIMKRIKKSLFITRPSETNDLICESLSRFISSKEGEFISIIRADYASLNLARSRLIDAVSRSLVNPEKNLKYDQVSDVLYVKDVDVALRFNDGVRKKLIPDDSTRKRHSADLIIKAETDYRMAAEHARAIARSELQNLAKDLANDKQLIEGLIFFSHWGVVVTTTCMHVESSLRRGWSIPSVTNDGSSIIESLWPYWLDKTQAVANTVTLTDGHTAVLTAPNMSGKSTLIRSIGAVALLGNCGLMVPSKSAIVQKVSDLLVVSPSGDRPNEGLSAFAAEADSMATAIRHIEGNKSVLLLVDEFGRGTSGRDASALSAAVLEWLARQSNAACIWATHLHELYQTSQPLEVTWIQMEGYKLVPGQCTDSKGIEIARSHGFPDTIIRSAMSHANVEADFVDSRIVDGICVENMYKSVSKNEDAVIVKIPPGCTLPPALQASHVLYILRLQDGKYYVGETANFADRLSAHGRRFGGDIGEVWVAPQRDRSRARSFETSMIREFMRNAIPLVSITDGFHREAVLSTATTSLNV